MTQEEYDAICQCINYGAPALTETLMTKFNLMIDKAQKYQQLEAEKKTEVKDTEKKGK